MTPITQMTRCVYFHIEPVDLRQIGFNAPMEFLLLADDRPVRRIHRLYGSFATERILLDSREHILTLQSADGTVLQSLRLPANDYSYMITLSEARDFSITRAQPAAQPPAEPRLPKLASLLTGKLTRMLNPASPFCHLYQDLTQRDLDYLWFEFWETALLIRFMPKSGYIPDLKKDFDTVEPYDRVQGIRSLCFTETLALDSMIEQALTESEAAEKLEIFRTKQGFLAVRPK